MEKMNFKYGNDFGIEIKVNIPEEINLTQLMAYFVNFTRAIGYYAGSWEDVIVDINAEGGISDAYTLFDWASDKLIDMKMER